MGASNALSAYLVYGSVLGDRALRVLAYMALVARDQDAEPWYGQRHEVLAEFALGRPIKGNAEDDATALRAVRRAITELHAAGAITVKRRQANTGRPVVYRLWLVAPSPDVSRPVSGAVDESPSPDAERPVSNGVIGRSVDGHRTRNVRSHIEEQREANTYEASVVTTNSGSRARDPPSSLRQSEDSNGRDTR